MKAKSIVISVAMATLIVALAELARGWQSTADFGVRQAAYAGLHLLITVLVIRGVKVGRWIAIGLWGAFGMGLLYLGVKQITYSLGGEIRSIGLSLVYLTCASVLLRSNAEKYFSNRVTLSREHSEEQTSTEEQVPKRSTPRP